MTGIHLGNYTNWTTKYNLIQIFFFTLQTKQLNVFHFMFIEKCHDINQKVVCYLT